MGPQFHDRLRLVSVHEPEGEGNMTNPWVWFTEAIGEPKDWRGGEGGEVGHGFLSLVE